MQARWVEIEGEVLAAPAPRPCQSVEDKTDDQALLFTSPGFGRSCLLYRVELTALQRLLEASGRPCRERAGRRFLLQTANGTRWPVDPGHAKICWSTLPVSLDIGRHDAQDKRLRQLYGRLGRPLRRRVVRLREWRVDVGDQLRVSAWLQRTPSPDGESGYRQPPALTLLSAVTLFRTNIGVPAHHPSQSLFG